MIRVYDDVGNGIALGVPLIDGERHGDANLPQGFPHGPRRAALTLRRRRLLRKPRVTQNLPLNYDLDARCI